jgi:putative addiction module component (TIGR02574 family)
MATKQGEIATTDIALRLKDELLRLSEEDRAELMGVLRESLEDEEDEGYHEAWEAELNRRSDEIQSGKAIGRPASEVFDELRKRYS